MAKNDNLTDYLTDLADGIRAKKGTTEPINPQDFRKEIESISGGGNGGGAEGDWEYYKFDGVNLENTLKEMGYSDEEIKMSMFEVFPFFIYCHGVVCNTRRSAAEVNLNYYLLPLEESKMSYIKGFKQMISLDAIKGSALDGVTSVADAIEKWVELMPDTQLFANALTPCTKEEFDALITE